MLTHLREVLGDVQNIIEDAAQKDSFIAKTHKRLSTRLGLNVRSEFIFLSLCQQHVFFLEIRFSSLEFSSQGQFSNSPIAHRPSRGSSRDLCVLLFVLPPCLAMLIPRGCR
jgi:hypothetical protein